MIANSQRNSPSGQIRASSRAAKRRGLCRCIGPTLRAEQLPIDCQHKQSKKTDRSPNQPRKIGWRARDDAARRRSRRRKNAIELYSRSLGLSDGCAILEFSREDALGTRHQIQEHAGRSAAPGLDRDGGGCIRTECDLPRPLLPGCVALELTGNRLRFFATNAVTLDRQPIGHCGGTQQHRSKQCSDDPFQKPGR